MVTYTAALFDARGPCNSAPQGPSRDHLSGWIQRRLRVEPKGNLSRARETIQECAWRLHDYVLDQKNAGRESLPGGRNLPRSEEHTSELQSRGHLVCR